MKLDHMYPRGLYHVSFWKQYCNDPLSKVLIAFNYGHGGGKGPKVLLTDEIERLNLTSDETTTLVRRIITSSQEMKKEEGCENDASWIDWNLLLNIARNFLPDDAPLHQELLLATIEKGALTGSYKVHFLEEIELEDGRRAKSIQAVLDYAEKIGTPPEKLRKCWLKMLAKRAENLLSNHVIPCWEGIRIGGRPVQEDCSVEASVVLLRELRILLTEHDPASGLNEKVWMDILDRLVWAGSVFFASKVRSLFMQSYARGTIGVADYLLKRFGERLELWHKNPRRKGPLSARSEAGMFYQRSYDEVRRELIDDAIDHADTMCRFDIAAALVEELDNKSYSPLLFREKAAVFGQTGGLIREFKLT